MVGFALPPKRYVTLLAAVAFTLMVLESVPQAPRTVPMRAIRKRRSAVRRTTIAVSRLKGVRMWNGQRIISHRWADQRGLCPDDGLPLPRLGRSLSEQEVGTRERSTDHRGGGERPVARLQKARSVTDSVGISW